MAISEPRYAAQVVDKDGGQYKFDDIGCMLSFIRKQNLQNSGAVFFAMDYLTGKDWLPVNSATFVRSPEVPSPMSSGLAAFRDTNTAKDFAAKNKGQVLTFTELLKSEDGAKQHACARRGRCCRRG